MKKRWKIFWITCAITGVIGIACLAIAIGMGVKLETIENELPNGISIGKYEVESESKYVTRDEETDLANTYDEITELDIDLTAGELEIIVFDGDSIAVETEGISKKLNLHCYKEGNELMLTSEKNLSGIVDQSLGTVYIYIPEDYWLDEVSINVHAGTLYIEKIQADELSIDVGAGEANIDCFIAKEADFDCGAGGMSVCGKAEQLIDIDCGLGQITYHANDCEEDYNYNLACGVGKIVCGSNSYSGIGGDKKVNNHANKDMDIDCGLGEVVVEFEGHHAEEQEEHHEENHF